MAGIADLGNGLGYIYVVDPATGDILMNLQNTPTSVKKIKRLGVDAAGLAASRTAIGSITVTVAPTGSGNITAVNVNGVNQIGSNIAYTVADTTTSTASKIASGINSYAATSGVDYTAIHDGANKVYLIPVSGGSSVNGHVVGVTVGANPPTVTTSNITGGTENTGVIDSAQGYEFWLDADYSGSAVPGDYNNAVQITNFIVKRGLESNILVSNLEIDTGILSYDRKGFVGYIAVDTEGSAASDNLTTITPTQYMAEGDIVILYGANASRIVTIAGGGNLNVASDWSSSDSSNCLWLRYSGGSFYEIARSAGTAVPTYTSFRTEGFPFLDPTKYGVTSLTAANNTTSTVTVNSSKNVILITGTVTLSSGDYIVALDSTGAVAGDLLWVVYAANVTVGSYKVTIDVHDLTATEALNGSSFYTYIYSGSNWRKVNEGHDFSGGYEIETAFIQDNAVTADKLADELTYDVIVVDVSFESGEQGDYKIKMPYACTVNELYARATKAIAATDAGTIVPKNNGGTTMTSGTVTFAASDAFGTAYTTTPSANNTFAAGDLMTLTTAKTTAGGKAQISIKVTKS